MTVFDEYMKKITTQKWGYNELEQELMRLIKLYNDCKNTNLLIYSASTMKPIPECSLNQNDFYFIKDLLDAFENGIDIDIYIETPGGSAETAEEIVKYIRRRFNNLSFIISGEAKSAGTILVMAGKEIYMTDTGSLGPIDAQLHIGRSWVSAHDYTNWIEEKRKEALKNNNINPADAIILGQITPGELKWAINAQNYAVEMVKNWLEQYKFKDWEITNSEKRKVTSQMKKARARAIAKKLNDHSKWKTHNRSLKREDLENIGLRINDLETNPEICDIVYRIHTICRLIYVSSNTYKIIATEKNKITFDASPINNQNIIPITQPDTIEINQICPKCGNNHYLYAKILNNSEIDLKMKNKGAKPFPKNNCLICDCGFTIDLLGIKNEIESQINKKIIV